jgi:hypothetical protein
MVPTWIAGAVLCASVLLALGCAFGELRWNDPLKRRFTLEDTQREYTDYVRWSAFDKASVYVEPEAREQYLAGAPKIDELRFTDYEFNPVTLDEEMGEATVEVTYSAYRPHSLIEIEVTEVQRWRRHGKGNNWMVTPTFSGPSQLVGSRDLQ